MLTYPCAKINLGLNVIERRADGYHNLQTVFLPIPLTDVLEVHRVAEQFHSDEGCRLVVSGTDSLCPERQNLVVKAYDLLSQYYPLPPVIAHLKKVIPSQAGMGGGSSDAAYMLRLLNEEFQLGLTIGQLQDYAARLGADCPFFVNSRADVPLPVYATGIGEILQPFSAPLSTLSGMWLALVRPPVAVSTRDAYAHITPHPAAINCREVVEQPIDTWRGRLTNDFEDTVFDIHPSLRQVRDELYSHGAIYAAMSGSGSTIFGIFRDEPSFVSHSFHDSYTATIQLSKV